MKNFVLSLILLCNVSYAQEGIEIPGFGETEAAAANPIGITGPIEADKGEEVTFRITGTPAVDLNDPLTPQLGWLMGDDRMYVYYTAPGQQKMSLDVQGVLVFGASGATMQPIITFQTAHPGEYRVLVDWNYGQNQLAEHIFVVEGEERPDPTPEPDPPVPPVPPLPPLNDILVTIIEEADDRAGGLSGAKLEFHIREVQEYLTKLPVNSRLWDQHQPIANQYMDLLEEYAVTRLPALVVSAPSPDNELLAVLPFGEDAAETIAKLKDAGVVK